MSKQNQTQFHKRKWTEALKAVETEKNRLMAEKGKAVIGPENPVFLGLVMQEIQAEQRYKQSLNS